MIELSKQERRPFASRAHLPALLALVVASLLGATPATAHERRTALEITRAADQQSVAGPASTFTGRVTITGQFQRPAPSRVGGAIVRFERGARTNWHIHPLGQTLIVTEGVGWTQVEGGAVEVIRAGDVVWCPPGMRHWHGATPTTAMAHIAIHESENGSPVAWMERVTDAQYQRGPE